MVKHFKEMSLMPKGLRYKTMIAFCLMSVIPLLICVWIATTYIFPNINLFFGMSLGNISFILLISVFISLLGLYLTKEMINPLIKMAEDAKAIMSGNVDAVVMSREDEIGDLGRSLNLMNQKIRENLEELRMYGEKTKLINIEINKKVLALSGLLQIGNLIASASELSVIMDFISQKLSDVSENAVSFIMMLDESSGEFKIAASCNLEDDKKAKLKVSKDECAGYAIVVDASAPSKNAFVNTVLENTGLKNLILFPVFVYRKHCAVFGLGNNKGDFVFKDDEKELLNVFVKQVAIAIENDMLVKKAKELAILDELTGLYNQNYMQGRLDEEIKRAVLYQRPCGYLLVDIDDFKELHERLGEAKTEALLKAIGELIKGSVTEIDKVARLPVDKFAVVLPEKNKKQSAHIAEEIKNSIEEKLCKLVKISGKVTVSIGVSENPIDGSTANELMDKADRLVRNAKALGKNRVVV